MVNILLTAGRRVPVSTRARECEVPRSPDRLSASQCPVTFNWPCVISCESASIGCLFRHTSVPCLANGVFPALPISQTRPLEPTQRSHGADGRMFVGPFRYRVQSSIEPCEWSEHQLSEVKARWSLKGRQCKHDAHIAVASLVSFGGDG